MLDCDTLLTYVSRMESEEPFFAHHDANYLAVRHCDRARRNCAWWTAEGGHSNCVRVSE